MQNPPFPVSNYKAAFMLNSTNQTVTTSVPFPVSNYDAVWMLNPPSAGGTVPDYSNGGTMNGPLIVHPKITTDLIESTNGTVDTLSSNYISNSQNIGTRTLAATYSVTAPSATITSVSSTNSNTQNLTSTVSSNLTNLSCTTGHITDLNSNFIISANGDISHLDSTTLTATNLNATTANVGTESVGTLTALTKVQTPLGDITNVVSDNVASLQVNAGNITLDAVLTAPTFSSTPHVDINGTIKTKNLTCYNIYNRDDVNFGVGFNKIQCAGSIVTDTLDASKILPTNTFATKQLKLTSTSTSLDLSAEASGYVNFYFSRNEVLAPSTTGVRSLAFHYIDVTRYTHYCLRYHMVAEVWLDGTTPVYPYLFELMSDVAQHGNVNSFVNYDPVWDNKNYTNAYRPVVNNDNLGNISIVYNSVTSNRMMMSLTCHVTGFYWP